MTNLARFVAPPTKKEEAWWLVVLGVIMFFIFMEDYFLIALRGLVIAFLSGKSNLEIHNYNKNICPLEYEVWLNSYFCHRCGNIFLLN